MISPVAINPVRFCRVCECAMADALITLTLNDSVYGGPYTMTLSYQLGYWFTNVTISSVVYTYELRCNPSSAWYYLIVHNNSNSQDCTSTNHITSVPDCTNPNFTFTMPVQSGSDCGLYPSGGTVTIHT